MIEGVLNDLVTSFNGVLSIKHSISFGIAKSAMRVFFIVSDVTNSAKSIGLRPYSSGTSLDAPLIRRDRTGLVF